MRRPDHPSGFFIPDLVHNVFGEAWAHPNPVLAEASRWNHPHLLNAEVVAQIRTAFAQGGRVPHVCLSDALQPERANALHAALTRARFTPHHHSPYPLSIARLDQQEPSALTEFTQWLRTDEAASYHAWLVGWPGPLVSKQVQVSQMTVGERFPVHIDTEEEGLAVVYNFTRGWEERFGGVLHFPRPSGKGDALRIPPLFNSVFIFRSLGAPHGVTEVTPEAGDRLRYTVTTFFLAPG